MKDRKERPVRISEERIDMLKKKHFIERTFSREGNTSTTLKRLHWSVERIEMEEKGFSFYNLKLVHHYINLLERRREGAL